jgi:hypothetical protein
MRDRVHDLGWSEAESVGDPGGSAAGTVARAGFEGTVAGVCLGTVGAVAAWEVSGLARNSRDWPQLIEMSRGVDTLLIDQGSLRSRRLAAFLSRRRWTSGTSSTTPCWLTTRQR